MGVDQPCDNSVWFLEAISCERMAAACAFDVDAPYHSVSGVAGVSGNVAIP